MGMFTVFENLKELKFFFNHFWHSIIEELGRFFLGEW